MSEQESKDNQGSVERLLRSLILKDFDPSERILDDQILREKYQHDNGDSRLAENRVQGFSWIGLFFTLLLIVTIVFSFVWFVINDSRVDEAGIAAENYGFVSFDSEVKMFYFENKNELRLMSEKNKPRVSLKGTLENQDSALIDSSDALYSTVPRELQLGDAVAVTFGDPVREIVVDFGNDRWRFIVSEHEYDLAKVLLNSKFNLNG